MTEGDGNREREREREAGREPDGPRAELPDQGAMVDEHGRAPGVPSRTGTGSSAPPADPARVERAAAEDGQPGRG